MLLCPQGSFDRGTYCRCKIDKTPGAEVFPLSAFCYDNCLQMSFSGFAASVRSPALTSFVHNLFQLAILSRTFISRFTLSAIIRINSLLVGRQSEYAAQAPKIFALSAKGALCQPFCITVLMFLSMLAVPVWNFRDRRG